MNIDQFKKLESLEKNLSIFEDQLIERIPFAFINFLDLQPFIVGKIISNHSNYIRRKINYKDKNLVDLINKFNQIAGQIFQEFKIPNFLIANELSTFEHNFLASILIGQYTRREIIKSYLASYKLEKILSKTEQSIYKTNSIKIKTLSDISFELNDYLKKDIFGNFDINNTIENEVRNGDIRIFLSSIVPISIQTNYLYEEFLTNSKYIPFSILNKDFTRNLCGIISEKLITQIVKKVYRYMSENILLQNAKETVRKNLQREALEYLNNGDSKNNNFKLDEVVYNTARVEIEKLGNSYDKKFKDNLALEVFRLSLIMIKNWYDMPEYFYTVNFRDAKLEEKIYPEVSHAMDVYRYSETNQKVTDAYETYVIAISDLSRELINSAASKGIKTPKHTQNFIEVEKEPSLVKRFTSWVYSE